MSDDGPIYVRAGEVFWSTKPREFRTVLGSCVSVCLWDATRRAGGINHFLLPRARDGQADPRYGDVAIPRLLAGLREVGCRDLVAKIFGGAAVMEGLAGVTVGGANVAVADEVLAALGVPIVARRVGGRSGMSLRFTVDDGLVLVAVMQGAGRQR